MSIVTCEEYIKFQDSKSIFMISDFKIFVTILLSSWGSWILVYCFFFFFVFFCICFRQRKNSTFWELSPIAESFLAICHPRANFPAIYWLPSWQCYLWNWYLCWWRSTSTTLYDQASDMICVTWIDFWWTFIWSTRHCGLG